ncbi:hypothetical protein UFOVP124_40 [uncultured Caudovirales phage]|uniref:Uncharacterized protein n=1 Tax=uncultured Caudovirales phage TaxID=2100421 RepID=A0A6J5L8R5_9CAUD|nr:hypothetical protein UFOVP124_40 [uncultured Caudovirales phage]
MPSVFSNPQIIRFCNATIRPLADDVTRLAVAVSSVMVVVQAQGILATLQAADQSAVIDDGSVVDGRPPITVGQLLSFLSECQKAHTALDTTTAVQQAAAIQVNGYIQ